MGWVAAVRMEGPELKEWHVLEGKARFAYEPGLLALREGPLLEAAFRGLSQWPELLMVNATGRDHPRKAGLAVHLGVVLGVPTLGVTRSPLCAEGSLPSNERGSRSPLFYEGQCVAYWVRTKTGVAPLVVHPGWRVEAEEAVRIVLSWTRRYRTPEPLRQARKKARQARSSHLLRVERELG
ncbi:Endonuclease V [Candidatus Methylacidithermus pantelleriae]|uniref:Endonuclease V n=1 Tax=Candidatus Methylacidithermus pantelleriae TaxID=2744239 RepID=A0A8J2BL44_9BACT|nr:Endonuclease V [Candidatus Methylacidithermus pantelleriae]